VFWGKKKKEMEKVSSVKNQLENLNLKVDIINDHTFSVKSNHYSNRGRECHMLIIDIQKGQIHLKDPYGSPITGIGNTTLENFKNQLLDVFGVKTPVMLITKKDLA
jgi:hypothetical protein